MLPHKNPAGTIADITLNVNRLAESSRGVRLLSSRERQESMDLRVLPDPLHGVLLPMVGRDWEAPDCQAEAMHHSRNVDGTQNQGRVRGGRRSRSDRPAVGGEGGERAVKNVTEPKLDQGARSWHIVTVGCYCIQCVGGGHGGRD